VVEGDGTVICVAGGVSPGPRNLLTLRNAGDVVSPPLSGAMVPEGPGAESFTVTPVSYGALVPRVGCSIEIWAIRSENGSYAATLRVAPGALGPSSSLNGEGTRLVTEIVGHVGAGAIDPDEA